MNSRTCLTIILAAGEGTRMKSAAPKVLHEIAGLPMICHVLRAAAQAGEGDVAVVLGREAEAVRARVAREAPQADFFVQAERLGTAHAVLAARAALEKGHDDLLILFGDTPLVQAGTLAEMRRRLATGADVVAMGFEASDPAGYGRLILDGDRLVAIREDRDCSDDEKRIRLCNGGLMALSGRAALDLLDAVRNDNAKGEYYLTDVVAIAAAKGLEVVAARASAQDVLGVNTRAELAEVEAIWQACRRRALMLQGVTFTAPESVHLSHDTEIEADALVEPNVVFAPGVRVAGGARIRAFSHLEGATVGANVEVGPFARLRPGTVLEAGSKVGNFCEVKNARVEAGAKVNHLTYIGDAHVGAKANIGAGTITCNYDGFGKHRTEIGAGAFIGSNSSLVAPVAIGEGAYVASGSVITEDVPDDALAFGRARQVNKPGLARNLRERLAAEKAKAKAG